MPGGAENRRLERRAKTLMLNKNIPAAKMNVVRELLANSDLEAEEKYSAIIDLIKNCPNKQHEIPKSDEKVDLRRSRKVEAKKTKNRPNVKSAKIVPLEDAYNGPSKTSLFVSDIYKKYKHLKLFKKRYLVHADNYFKVSIKKRLIPSKRLFKVLQVITAYQDKLMTRLPGILKMILDDEAIEEPETFNYLRIFQKWMMLTPLKTYEYNTMKWLDETAFEAEFKDYITHFYAFDALDTSTKENMIQLVEEKLRLSEDLLKEEVKDEDTEQEKTSKEKKNLKKEQAIYNYLLVLRSFITSIHKNDPVTTYLQKYLNIESLAFFLKVVIEALVFRQEINMHAMISYYDINPPKVKKDKWDYSDEYLKSIGKDFESRINQELAYLQRKVAPYEELVKFISLKFEGQNVLLRAFEDQWKIVKNRRQNFENIYEDNFFMFIDECVNYFVNVFWPFLDGSTIVLIDEHNRYDASIFSEKYFQTENAHLQDVINEMHSFIAKNPTIMISRKEMRMIKSGQIKTMREVNLFMRRIGELFYKYGVELQQLNHYHQVWLYNGLALNNENIIRRALDSRVFPEDVEEKGYPIPFYDCKVEQFAKIPKLDKLFIGKYVMSESLHDGIFKHIIAFCFQVAYECFDDSLFNDLQTRKDLRKRIKNLNKVKD